MSKAPKLQLLGPKASRFRLAVVLLLMFATILGGKFWEDIYVENLRFDCGSLYRDRLMPAVILFRLGDEIHNKREALEEHLHGDEGSAGTSLDYRLGQHDAAIQGHIDQIKRTYLVDEESRLLEQLQNALSAYNKKESEHIRRHRNGERVAYGAEMREAFSSVRAELVSLTKVQEDVGQELNQDSLASASHVTSLLYFQLGVTFILGLLASGLAMSLEARTAVSAAPRDEGLH
jgi:hypothetical protein